MESLSVLCDLLITSLKPIYYCRTCKVSKTFFAQTYYIAFIVYGASIFELSAIINRIISTFCCLMLLLLLFLFINQFSNTTIKSVLELTGFIFRDGINLAILILLNCLIFIRFKNDLSKKKVFLMPASSNTKITMHQDELANKVKNLPSFRELSLLNRIKKCENKQTIMVFVTCLCSMIGRLPILVYFIQ
ncbi:hypothetical protein BpHYR1_042234 [Brachionus plicatilis]|uniref:Uncharacterized protein n=1 Tax=Brachionus plicatilis TaxID=10195 RepID=A0A3M7P3U5_BRAPC|nr:hypothetical protein BpHYR1_042234 [Brachionus plicatilis]